MKHLVIASAILLAGTCGNSMAGCAASGYTTFLQASANAINSVLTYRRVNATAPDGENWKEDHCTIIGGTAGSGKLFKVGDGTPADPRSLTGKWSLVDINGAAANGWRVRYNYNLGSASDPSLIYTWRLYRKAATGGLCWEDETGNIIASMPSTPPTIPGSVNCL